MPKEINTGTSNINRAGGEDMEKPLSYVFKKSDVGSATFYGIFSGLMGHDVCIDYIEFKGLKVYPSFYIVPGGECKIEISLIKHRREFLVDSENGHKNVKIYPQGIDIGAFHTRLKFLGEVDHSTKSGLVFMCDRYFPKKITVICAPIKYRDLEKRKLPRWFVIHGIWEREFTGGCPERTYMMREAWRKNYGVVIEKRKNNMYRLYFSCGEMDIQNVTFEDLIIDVAIEGEYIENFLCSDAPSRLLDMELPE